jgi:hypothetical protein
MLLGGQEVRVRIEPVAVGLVVIAVVPYLALKLSWLTGAGIGVRDETVLTDLRSTRMVVANNLTILLGTDGRGAGPGPKAQLGLSSRGVPRTVSVRVPSDCGTGRGLRRPRRRLPPYAPWIYSISAPNGVTVRPAVAVSASRPRSARRFRFGYRSRHATQVHGRPSLMIDTALHRR